MNHSLRAAIERALDCLKDPTVKGGCPPLVVESLRRQLEWCRDYLDGIAVPERPGPFSMGLIATRELDMYGDRPELAGLINEIERQVNAHMSASGDDHALATAAYEVADLHRAGKLSRKRGVAALRKRFPSLTHDQIEVAFARGLSRPSG